MEAGSIDLVYLMASQSKLPVNTQIGFHDESVESNTCAEGDWQDSRILLCRITIDNWSHALQYSRRWMQGLEPSVDRLLPKLLVLQKR